MERVRLLLEQYRTLAKLEAEIKGRSDALEKLDSEIGKAEERLATSTKAFSEESKKVESFVKNIQAMVKKSTDATLTTLTGLEASAAKDYEKALGTVTKTATGSLTVTQTRASEALGELLKQSGKILVDIRKTNSDLAEKLRVLVKDTDENLVEQSSKILEGMQTISSDMATQHKAQLEEWGRIQAQAGEFASKIRRANTLLGFENYEDGLKLLDKDEINLLISRIIEWSKAKTWITQPTSQFRGITTRNDIPMLSTIQLEEALNWALSLLRIGKIGVSIRWSRPEKS